VAGVAGHTILDGDASLRRRPMERVAEPLRAMGARVKTTAGRPPVVVRGGGLAAIDWRLPGASAQGKSAILLGRLRGRRTQRVRRPAAAPCVTAPSLPARGRPRAPAGGGEPLPSRDHSERLLAHMGASIARD